MVVDRVADHGSYRGLQGSGGQVELVGLGPGAAVDVADQAVLRSRLGQPRPAAQDESSVECTGDGPLRRPGVAGFLAAAPFLALSTWDAEGGGDTSPRGDRGSVARVLDGRTLVTPDRKGNKRADTLHNLLQDDRLSFAALVPGHSGVLHGRGRGAITVDPALLATMALRGMPPHAALLIDVEHAEVTDGPAVADARLWSSGPGRATMPDITMPDMTSLAGDHLAAGAKNADGGPPAFLIKAVGMIPGIRRLLRLVVNRAYRSGLTREGYDDIVTGHPGEARPGGRPGSEAGDDGR